MNKYGNELKEVYIILNTLVKEDYNKIPKKTIRAIEENMNDDYEYVIDEDMPLQNNPMLQGTKEFLLNIYRDYLATDEERLMIKRKQAEDRALIIESSKSQNIDFEERIKEVNANKKNDNIVEAENQVLDKIVAYKENIFIKIMNQIKRLFGRRK